MQARKLQDKEPAAEAEVEQLPVHESMKLLTRITLPLLSQAEGGGLMIGDVVGNGDGSEFAGVNIIIPWPPVK